MKGVRKFRDPGAAIRCSDRYANTVLFTGIDESGYFWALGRKCQGLKKWFILQTTGGFSFLLDNGNKKA